MTYPSRSNAPCHSLVVKVHQVHILISTATNLISVLFQVCKAQWHLLHLFNGLKFGRKIVGVHLHLVVNDVEQSLGAMKNFTTLCALFKLTVCKLLLSCPKEKHCKVILAYSLLLLFGVNFDQA